MNKWLGILRFSALLSGILAELVPSLILEFRKRNEKVLEVVKKPPNEVVNAKIDTNAGLRDPRDVYPEVP